MGQKLDKAPKGAYDAIVYIDGSEIVAEDSNGRKIASGVAGVDDAVVMVPVFASYNNIYISPGAYHWATSPEYRSGMHVFGEKFTTVINLDADICPFDLTNLDHVTIDNMTVNVNVTQTNDIVKFKGYQTGCKYNHVHDVVSNGLPGLVFNQFYFGAIGTTGILYGMCFFNRVSDCDTTYGTTLKFDTQNIDSYCNGNAVDGIISNLPIIFCDFSRVGVNTQYSGCNSNRISHCQVQPGTNTTHMLRFGLNSTLRANFDNCIFWDIEAFANVKFYEIYAGNNHIKLDNCIADCSDTARMVNNSTNAITINTDNRMVSQIFQNKIIRVTADGYGDFSTLSDAVASITPTESNRCTIHVYGKILETKTIDFDIKDYIEVIGHGAKIVCNAITVGKNAALHFNSSYHSIIRNLEIELTTVAVANRYVVNTQYSHVVFDNVTLRNSAIAAGNSALYITDGGSVDAFNHCEFRGADGYDSCCGVVVSQAVGITNYGNTSFDDCSVYSGRGPGNWRYGFDVVNSIGKMQIKNCYGEHGGSGGESCSVRVCYAEDLTIDGCKFIPITTHTSWSYTSENSGRFIPFTAIPYMVMRVAVKVVSATGGATLAIGTTVGGSQVVSGLSLASVGIKTGVISNVEVAGNGYLYATPSVGVAEGSFSVEYQCIDNSQLSRAVRIQDTYGDVVIRNSILRSNGESSALYYVTTKKNYVIKNIIETLDTVNQLSIYSSSPITGEKFIDNILIGPVGTITGIDGKSSGSSTGTGSEQTIAHGLAAIPTGCKAWIRYPISATVYAEKEIRMDSTNIYPKVKNGLAYDWRVE